MLLRLLFFEVVLSLPFLSKTCLRMSQKREDCLIVSLGFHPLDCELQVLRSSYLDHVVHLSSPRTAVAQRSQTSGKHRRKYLQDPLAELGAEAAANVARPFGTNVLSLLIWRSHCFSFILQTRKRQGGKTGWLEHPCPFKCFRYLCSKAMLSEELRERTGCVIKGM